jgi:hypothetical protein
MEDRDMTQRTIEIETTQPVVELRPLDDDYSLSVDDHWPMYEAHITVDGLYLGSVRGWRFCGHLKPGAHADIDGSGIALWGDSQPGGWRVLDSDGEFCGLPRCRVDWVGETLTVVSGDNLGGVLEIRWSDLGCTEGEVEHVADRLSDALADAAPTVPEPERW